MDKEYASLTLRQKDFTFKDILCEVKRIGNSFTQGKKIKRKYQKISYRHPIYGKVEGIVPESIIY